MKWWVSENQVSCTAGDRLCKGAMRLQLVDGSHQQLGAYRVLPTSRHRYGSHEPAS
jgi:hypothetical protein